MNEYTVELRIFGKELDASAITAELELEPTLATTAGENPRLLEFETRLRENGWSRIWGNISVEHWGGKDWKNKGKYGNWYHITVYPKPSDKIVSSKVYLDQMGAPPEKITIHCENGNPQNPFHKR